MILRLIKHPEDKYLDLIKEFKISKRRSMEGTASALNELSQRLRILDLRELKLVETEVNAVVEGYKQTSLLTIMLSLFLTVFSAVLSSFNNSPELVELGLVKFDIRTPLFFVIIIIIVCIGNYSKRYKTMLIFQSVLQIVIKEKDEDERNTLLERKTKPIGARKTKFHFALRITKHSR